MAVHATESATQKPAKCGFLLFILHLFCIYSEKYPPIFIALYCGFRVMRPRNG